MIAVDLSKQGLDAGPRTSQQIWIEEETQEFISF